MKYKKNINKNPCGECCHLGMLWEVDNDVKYYRCSQHSSFDSPALQRKDWIAKLCTNFGDKNGS